ncbi:MAG: PAAR domain-containing protein [Minicystis sp.]
MEKANPTFGQPAAKQGDTVVGIDTHIIMIPSPGGPVPTPVPMPFNGKLTDGLSTDTYIENVPAAIEGSVADNVPPHVPAGGPFQSPPANKAKVQVGSQTVLINNKPAAMLGSVAKTCNDPTDAPNGNVIATSSVLVGG